MHRLATWLTRLTLPMLWVLAVVTGSAQAADRPAREDPRFAAATGAYAQRAAVARHREAARLFSEIAADYPKDRDIQIWCARTAYYCAHRFLDDKSTMARVAKRGVTCGKRLERWHPRDYDGQLWTALARFKFAVADSFIPPVGQIELVAKQLEAMVVQKPNDFRGHMLVGAMYRDLPGWPVSIGDEKRALAILLRAAKLAPTDAELLLELAAAYAAVGRDDEARATYRKCIREGTGPAELTWEAADARAYAKKMLAELD